MTREEEWFAQTDPNDAASVFQIKAVTRSFNETAQEFDYTVTHPAVRSRRYAVEASTDGQQWSLVIFSRPGADDPDRVLGFSLKASEDPGQRLMVRLRTTP